MNGSRRVWGWSVAVVGLAVLGAPAARGQGVGEASSSGVGLVAVPSVGTGPGSFGLMAVPVPSSSTSQGGTTSDPLGLGAVYGPAVPMTPGQAGLFMLATQQRMLGLGNGRLSGVRPGPGPGVEGDLKAARQGRGAAGGHPAEAHTRNSNVPGGQAARFFNRGGLAASRPRPFYNRPLRQFPQGGQ